MKIAIIGYGKMGRSVEELALLREHQVLLKIDSENDWLKYGSRLAEADVAVEFSMPGTAVSNIHRCFEKGVPVVTGTTGWNEKVNEIKDLCLRSGNAIFIAANFNIGVNIFFEVNKKLASLMSRQVHYDLSVSETHHIHKIDRPSGTAIQLAEDIIQRHDTKNTWTNRQGKGPDELEIISIREGEVPGTHIVRYTSEYDKVEIKHEALSRKGFAVGALMAAEWIIGRKGVFGMSDMLGL